MDEPFIRAGLPVTQEQVEVQAAAHAIIGFLANSGFDTNRLLSALMTTIWLAGNTIIGVVDREEGAKLPASIHTLADMLEAELAKKNGSVS